MAEIVIFVILGCVAFAIRRHRPSPATPPAPVALPSWASSVPTDLPLPPETFFTTPDQADFMESAFTYGFYLTLGRDVCGSRRVNDSDAWSNGPTNGIGPGRVQLWRSHRLVVRWLRSQHTLPSGPYCRPGLRTGCNATHIVCMLFTYDYLHTLFACYLHMIIYIWIIYIHYLHVIYIWIIYIHYLHVIYIWIIYIHYLHMDYLHMDYLHCINH